MRHSLRSVGLFALLGAGLVFAQSQTQSIQGLVTDASGAVVSGAKVSYTNDATGVSGTALTNDTGNYSFQLVPVGNYGLKVEMQGFKAEAVKGLRVETAAQVRQDFKLQVGNVAESVEVSAAAVTLQTENAVVGGVIENKRIIELPLNGRNVAQLAVLVPGVQFGDRTGRANGLGGYPISGQSFSVSANGQREIHQVVSLDGVDAKDPRIHITNFVPSIEAIEEFKIETNAYSASVGFGGGAVVNITMKSGTNALHGTLFEFLRNSKMDAEDYFLNFQLAPGQARKPKNTLRRNQFGVVVSGPLIKNKTFWAFNWESRRERVGVVQEGFFPTDEMRDGNFAVLGTGTINPATGRLFRAPIVIYDAANGGLPFANNIIPKARQHPGIINNVLPKYIPRAQFRPLDPLDVNARASVVQPINTNTYFGRVDHFFSDANRVFGRVAIDRSRQDSFGLLPEFPRINNNKVENLASQWVHTFNQNMINEVRFGFNRSNGGTSTPRQNSNFDVDSLGIGQFRVFNDGNRKFTPLENGLPSLGFGIGDGGEFNQLDTYQMGSHLSWIKGKHNLKFGGEYYYITIQRAAANVPNGQASFGGLESGYNFASFLLGLPTQTRTAEGWPYTYPVSGRQGYYVNDDFKVSSRLTVNLGLRFDYIGASRDTRGLQRVLDFPGKSFDNGRGAGYKTPDGRTIPILFPNQADETGAIKLFKQDIRFFMPRIGIAFRPTDKWVIRTGAGWFDNINHMNTWTILNLNPPKSGVFDFFAQTEPAAGAAVTGADGNSYNVATRRFTPGQPILSMNDPFLTAGGATGARTGAQSITTVPPDTKDGAVWKWSFDIQRQLPMNMALTVGYVGSKGTHAGNSIGNYNSPEPSSNTNVNVRRPFTQFYDPALPRLGIQQLGAVRYLDSYGETFHHGLQMKLDKRYSKGLSLGVAYTLSKSHGDGENGGQEGASFQNPRDRKGSRGLYRFDQRHNLVMHYVWELPGQNMAGPLKYIIGGWQSNGILSLRSGFPFNIGQGDDLNTGSPIRPDRIKDGRLDNPTRQLWFDPSAFQRVTCNIPSRPDLCHYGSNGYNTMRAPSQANIDFSLYKNFKFKERYQVQYRWELFNATNTPYFGEPNGVGFATINSITPDAARMGEVRNTRTSMRIMQMGLKFFF